MNAKDIYTLWKEKYEETYKEPYKSPKIPAELSLLKRLIVNYGEEVVRFSLVWFINNTKKEKTVILNFATPKHFENRFEDLLKLKKILPYFKLFSISDDEDKEKLNELIKEYYLYAIEADIVSDKEKVRKKEILDQLEELKGEICKKN
jgi:hypothetical protein